MGMDSALPYICLEYSVPEIRSPVSLDRVAHTTW